MRRAPVDKTRAIDALETLRRVADGGHSARPGSPGATFLERLALTKLVELLDDLGGAIVIPSSGKC